MLKIENLHSQQLVGANTTFKIDGNSTLYTLLLDILTSVLNGIKCFSISFKMSLLFVTCHSSKNNVMQSCSFQDKQTMHIFSNTLTWLLDASTNMYIVSFLNIYLYTSVSSAVCFSCLYASGLTRFLM